LKVKFVFEKYGLIDVCVLLIDFKVKVKNNENILKNIIIPIRDVNEPKVSIKFQKAN